ncbi:MAG: outer membrane protein assembly factor BamD, partial [Chlamydiia bacterium]|nr:outer membrane protein assembly factor BamD [Chlamydiia bacterium]
AIGYARRISAEYGKSPFAVEVPYIIGEAYFNLGKWELANENLSQYLSKASSPKHFEEAIHYKFLIAEKFREGAKKPLFGADWLPHLLSGNDDAIAIYDDVIAALPHHEIAAKALLGKAEIQAKDEDYKPSLETLDLLIRRFPKHDLAAQAFREKSQVYLMQLQDRNLDPALLDLAGLNLRKFRQAFPRESRIDEVEKDLEKMKELFAENLMVTGRFFEKTKKIPAAILYYSKVIAEYPDTEAAKEANLKLKKLQ